MDPETNTPNGEEVIAETVELSDVELEATNVAPDDSGEETTEE